MAYDAAWSMTDIAYTYDRLGRRKTVTDAAGTRTFAYDADTLAPTTETYSGGLFAGLVMTQVYQDGSGGSVAGRWAGVQVGTSQDPDEHYAAAYGYDAYGRLNHVTGPGLPTGGGTYNGAWYTFTSGSDLVDKLQFKDDNQTPLAWVNWTYEDDRDLVALVENVWRPGDQQNEAMLSEYAYTNDNLARRTQIAYDGVAFGSPQNPITQVLTYNARNELTGSERDDSAALTRTYAYDPIGNRTGATQNEAPDADTIAYVRNALNQYKQVVATGSGGTLKQGLSYDEDGNLVERFIAGDMDCDGDVDFDDIDPFVVALEGQAAYETAYPDCNWLHGDVNGDGVVDFDDLDVFLALVSSGNAAVWVAYTWDAENRLIGVAPGGMPKSGDLKLAFVYDYMGRRVEKKVWTWDPQAGQGGAWVLTGQRKFVWNGWLLLMEPDGLNDDAVLRKRTWGLDLSGLTGGGSSAGLASSRSMLDGAGGIGGLLAVHDATIGQNGADYVYFYDANGNVGQVVDLSYTPGDPAGAIVARYEYDPYGNVTSQSGAYAAANPFRFSTKYWDDETGLGYWGYRYYDPKLGRWVNRDPIAERGGNNLYAYGFNNATTMCDVLGRLVIAAPFGCPLQEKAASQPVTQREDGGDSDRTSDEDEPYDYSPPPGACTNPPKRTPGNWGVDWGWIECHGKQPVVCLGPTGKRSHADVKKCVVEKHEMLHIGQLPEGYCNDKPDGYVCGAEFDWETQRRPLECEALTSELECIVKIDCDRYDNNRKRRSCESARDSRRGSICNLLRKFKCPKTCKDLLRNHEWVEQDQGEDAKK